MNVYSDFFISVDYDSWEYFACDFLEYLGYSIISRPAKGADGGKDAIVEHNGKRYLLSCKHYYMRQKAVGVPDEQSIVDRITQHNTKGFIGFYSTGITNSLQDRLNSFAERGYEYIIWDEKNISNYIPKIPSYILQKYNSPKGILYPMNVGNDEYTPLNCLGCGCDILHNHNIKNSITQLSLNIDNELEYLYGCKDCLNKVDDIGHWMEITQLIHIEQSINWSKSIEDRLKEYKPSKNFYENKNKSDSLIEQRKIPSNWGLWL